MWSGKCLDLDEKNMSGYCLDICSFFSPLPKYKQNPDAIKGREVRKRIVYAGVNFLHPYLKL